MTLCHADWDADTVRVMLIGSDSHFVETLGQAFALLGQTFHLNAINSAETATSTLFLENTDTAPPPDVIILDFDGGQDDLLSFIDAIRASETGDTIPIICVATSIAGHGLADVKEHGASLLVEKAAFLVRCREMYQLIVEHWFVSFQSG